MTPATIVITYVTTIINIYICHSIINSWLLSIQVSEFSSNWKKFERKFAVFIKLFKNKFALHICSTGMQFSQLPSAALPIILPHTGVLTVEAS
jgi:hypothetical protein